MHTGRLILPIGIGFLIVGLVTIGCVSSLNDTQGINPEVPDSEVSRHTYGLPECAWQIRDPNSLEMLLEVRRCRPVSVVVLGTPAIGESSVSWAFGILRPRGEICRQDKFDLIRVETV
jgi:hypothetical protein